MKKLSTFLLIVYLLFFTPLNTPAQTGAPPDDEFNLFLLGYAVVFCAIVLGCILVGAIVTVILMLLTLALISAGVVSTSVLVGLHKRSLSFGFKTFLILVCAISGTVAFSVLGGLINLFFHLRLGSLTAVLIGAAGGLLGGTLLGFVIFSLIRRFINYCRILFSLNPPPPPLSPSADSH